MQILCIIADPFRGGPNKLALCEALKGDGTAGKANCRSSCAEAMEKIKDQKPWFGLGKSSFECGLNLILDLQQL